MTKVDLATIVILDVGKNVGQRDDEKENETFFEKAKLCTRRIIERKIISQGKTLLAIVLLGTKKTDNPLAAECNGSFRHIDVSVPLQEPTWQMIRDLPETPSNSKGNWLDSLIVAADCFKNRISGHKILNKKIILLTNFEAPSHMESEDEIQQVLNGFKEEGYEVDVIGPDLYPESDKNIDIVLARQFVEGTNGATATFEYTMKYLAFHRKKAVNPTPWNVDLTIGPNINIPVSAYIKIKTEPVIKRWSKAVKDSVSNSASSSEAIDKSKVYMTVENQPVASNEVIPAYHYGQQSIPFADCDKTMLYQSGPKSLSVYGFTSYDNIHWQNLNSEGITYIFGRKKDKKAQKAVTCLAQCLSELNAVGIVRRVYNNGNAPKMYALIPVIDSDNLFCLSLVGLCYKEDIKNMSFPQTNLKQYECSEKQVNAFKELIKAMDLMKAYEATEYDGTEAFPVANTFSPTAQYILDCLTFRAMNPGKPLPKPREDIQLLLQMPPLIAKRSKEASDNIKELFTLTKIETVSRIKKTSTNEDHSATTSNGIKEEIADMPKINLGSLLNGNKTLKIGTLDPVKDYESIKIEGISQKELSLQMSEAIESLIVNNIDGDYTKALSAMAHFRADCVKDNPDNYNNWLKFLKCKLTDLKKQNVVATINSKGLNLILETENSLSKLKFTEDSEMYEYDTAPQLMDVNINSEINDIFDNM